MLGDNDAQTCVPDENKPGHPTGLQRSALLVRPSIDFDQDNLRTSNNQTQIPKRRTAQCVQEIITCILLPFCELYLKVQPKTIKYISKISGTDGSPSTDAPKRVVDLVVQRTNAQLVWVSK